MCQLILRVKYKAAGEGRQLLEFDDDDALDKRLTELKQLDTIASLTIYRAAGRILRTETWTTEPA